MCRQAKYIFLFYTTGLPLCVFIEQAEVTVFSVITATEYITYRITVQQNIFQIIIQSGQLEKLD